LILMLQSHILDTDTEDIYRLLFRLGGNFTRHGFYYTAEALLLCIQQPDRLLLITKWVYPIVAKAHHTGWQTVESNIRSFIDLVWKTNPALLMELAPYPLLRRPTPKQFLTIIIASLQQDRAG